MWPAPAAEIVLTSAGTRYGPAQEEPFQRYIPVWQDAAEPEPVHDCCPLIQTSEPLSTAAASGKAPAGRGTRCHRLPSQRSATPARPLFVLPNAHTFPAEDAATWVR